MSRIDDLKAKLKAREGVPGYEKNCEAIEAEIARLTPSDTESTASEPEVEKP